MDNRPRKDKEYVKSIYVTVHTVEPQLSKPNERHTIGSDNRGVRIDEGS